MQIDIPREGHVLVLRTCHANMTSRNGFQWPESGAIECPDWDPEPECGSGLHGWLWGEGNAADHGPANPWTADARWLVVEVEASAIVGLGGKVKFPRGVVVFCGDQLGATDFIISHGAVGRSVIGSTLTGGARSTLTGGARSTLTGGYDSTLTGGDRSTLTGGARSTLTGGDGSTLTGGDGSTLTGGARSTLTFRYWDPKKDRFRIVTAEIGEDGIEPGTAYVLDAETRKPKKKPTQDDV